ncbi:MULTISPECIES: YuzL family protein [Bacillaceae]|nr:MULTISPECIES: YuzL family protein [Bacillaceae]MDX8360828.1 YuzL family protein [Cytobacillus sp. IB215316]MDX8365970.1 YuzL family protein [Cytobacillus sp. IB215665]
MARMKKSPSKAGVSAASVKGNAGPTVENEGGKTQSQNQQYKKHNMQPEE